MKQRLTLVLGFATAVSLSFAKPAFRGVIEREQADGTTIEVLLHGDEHFHYTTDLQGNWLKEQDDKLVNTQALTDEQITVRRKKSKFNKAQEGQAAQGAYLAPRGLVILANFSDLQFQPENNQAAFDSLMNVQGYTYHGVSNSVRDYFIDQSDGQYTPQFDVVGPVTVNHTMQYYGGNDDANASEIIRDACLAAKADFNINFGDYDNDNDGYVDFVFVFYAGYGEADGASENTIWQHMFWLTESGINCNIDGKIVNLYACGSELSYYNRRRVSNPRDGISTCCHEFSHVCGLPDLYLISDNQYSTTKTLGHWDLMDNGTSNNNGWTPPSYSAYEKFFCGWITPTLLNSACDVILPELNSSNAACIITTTGQHNLNGISPNPTTFYLLENRQQYSWDEYLPGHGLLITKIMYSRIDWEYNQVNTDTRRRVDIQPADGKLSTIGDAGDTYPGTSGTTSFSKVASYPLTDITETDGIIRFKFMGGGQEIELSTEATEHDDIKIISQKDGIKICNIADNTTVGIFDLGGKLVAGVTGTQTNAFIPLSHRGIYIIKTGATTRTILF